MIGCKFVDLWKQQWTYFRPFPKFFLWELLVFFCILLLIWDKIVNIFWLKYYNFESTQSLQMEFSQIQHFISLFIQYASWNPSKTIICFKHNNIHHIWKKLWIGFNEILPI